MRDLGCGAISVGIEKTGDKIVWRDFGYENDYDENAFFDDYRTFGPFAFDAEEYFSVMNQAADENVSK